MRVLLDTNVLISFLLVTRDASPVRAVVRAAVAQTFTLLLPAAVIAELARKVSTSAYLAQRVPREDAEALAELLQSVTEDVPAITEGIPRLSRDPKDDYLLAYAAVGRADFLVTGDKDLLSLGTVAGVEIISPADFARRLGDQGLLAETD
jgi:putative PIN family toxin of toxin-antitoxin system